MIKCLILTMCKNEAATIRRTIDSARPMATAWCVVDTGSTDGTQDLALAAWEGLPGRLFERPWQDFGHNRTEAINLAKAIAPEFGCDWVFFLDADDTIEFDPGFQWPDPSCGFDAFHITVQRPAGVAQMQHAQVLLFRVGAPVEYRGKTHETPVVDGKIGPVLAGVRMIYRQDSARHKAGRRNQEDAELLEQQMRETPDDPRWVYYAAQSHRDAGNLERALELYDQRLAMGGWEQEVYSAALERAKLLERLHHPVEEVLFAYLAAHQLRPSRQESLAHAARFLREQGWAEIARELDARWRALPRTSDSLNVEEACQPRPGESALRVAIGIITYPRKPSPLPTTLTACIASDALVDPSRVHVFADCVNPALPPGVAFTARTQEEIDGFDELDGCRFMAVDNMARVLEWGAGAGDVVVELEDDVLFVRAWLSKALELLRAAEAASGRPVVLSLHDMFHPDRFGCFNQPVAVRIGDYRLFEPRDGAMTNGAQGHVMRATTARSIAAKLREGLRDRDAKDRKWFPPDVAMVWACRQVGARFVLSDPSLLLHQQNESTWFAADFPRSAAQTRNFLPW